MPQDKHTIIRLEPSEQHTSANRGWLDWSYHAGQWLKGGATVLGLLALGSVTYLAGSSLTGSRREDTSSVGLDSADDPLAKDDSSRAVVAVSEDVKAVAEIQRTMLEIEGATELTTPVSRTSVARELLSLEEADTSVGKTATPQPDDLELEYPVAESGTTSSKQRRAVLGEFRVNTYYTTRHQESPSVAALTDGGFVVIWDSDDQDGSAPGIFGQRYDASGVVQGAEFQANTHTTSSQIDPSIAALTSGGFVVMWASNDQDGHMMGVYGQSYDAVSVAQGSEFRVNTQTGFNQEFPSVVALTGGGFVVTWQSNEQDGIYHDVYGQRYDAVSVAQGSEFQVNTVTNYFQRYTSVAALMDGGFVVAWQSVWQDGNVEGIYGQRYDAIGITQGSEFQVNSYTINYQEFPSIAALTGGGFVVTWQSDGQDGDGYGIYGQRYDAAGIAQGSEFRVNTYTANSQGSSSVAALTDGGFVVTWNSEGQDGDGRGIYGQRYDALGVAQGSEFQVNTYTASSQQAPSVAALTGGGFVVTWQSDGQDGDQGGIYGQIFKMLVLVNKNLIISESQSIVLTPAMLSASDDFVNHIDLTFTVTNVLQGQFELLSNSTIPITSFTQPQITNGEVQFIHDGNEDAPSFNVSVSNGPYFTTPTAATITFTNVNDSPELNTTATPVLTTIAEDATFPSGDTLASIIADGSITDADGAAVEAMAITAIDDSNGVWQYLLNGTTWNAIAPVNSTSSLLLDSSHKVRFMPNADFNGEATFTFRAWDKTTGIAETKVDTTSNGGTTAFSTAEDTASITVTAVNDAPILTVTAGSVAYSENTPATIDSGLTITDIDSLNLANATVSITGGFVAAEDELRFENQNGITGSYNNTTGVLTLIGSSSVTNYQTALCSIEYQNSSEDPDTSPRTISFMVSDGALASDAVTRGITVTAVNDASVLSAAATPVLTAIAEDVTSPSGDTVSSIIVNGSITDADGVAVEAMAITAIDETNGLWEYSLDSSIWYRVAPVSSTNSLLLDSSHKVRFIPDADFNGEATFTFRAWDKSTGTAGIKVDTTSNGGTTTFSAAEDTATITVTAINDAPQLTGSGSNVTYMENAAPQVIDSGIAIVDIDSGNLANATVSITGGFVNGEDFLFFTDQNGITGSYNSTSGVLTLTGISSVANYQAALRSVAYQNSSENPDTSPRTISFVVNDGDLASDVVTRSITVIAVNDAPVLSTAATPVLTTIAEDTTNPSGDTVTNIIVNGSITDADGVAIAAIAITAIDETNGGWEYSLDGSTWYRMAPVSSANSLLLDSSHKVRFIPDADFNGESTFTFRAWDKSGGVASTRVDTTSNGGTTAFSAAEDTATIITITAISDAPQLTGSGGNVTYIENATPQVIDSGIAIVDIDSFSLANATVSITGGFVNGEDVLLFTDQNGITGSYDNSTGILTLTGSSSIANYQIALRSIEYQNSSEDPGTSPRTVSFVVNDGALSSEVVTRGITVIAVNDAPVLSTAVTPVLTTIAEDTTAPNGDTIANIIVDGSITDTDGTAVEAMAITSVDNTNGVWQYSSDGTNWNAIAPVSSVNSLLLGSSHKVRFIPNPGFNGDAAFTFRAWDKSSGVAETRVDTSNNGGTSAFSTAEDNVSIIVSPADDPAVTGQDTAGQNSADPRLFDDKLTGAIIGGGAVLIAAGVVGIGLFACVRNRRGKDTKNAQQEGMKEALDTLPLSAESTLTIEGGIDFVEGLQDTVGTIDTLAMMDERGEAEGAGVHDTVDTEHSATEPTMPGAGMGTLETEMGETEMGDTEIGEPQISLLFSL